MLIGGKGSAYSSLAAFHQMNHSENYYYEGAHDRKAEIRSRNLKQANQKEVIQILTEEELSLENAIENEHLRFEITKAQLTGKRFSVVLAAAKYYLQCPINEKEARMRQIFLEFFSKRVNIDISQGHFSQRIDVGLCHEPGRVYQNKYLIFGVDLLTSKNIITKYSRHRPLLKWVDASHCILEFTSIQVGWEFLRSQCVDFEDQKLVQWQLNENVLARNWVQLSSYQQLCFVRRLFARNLTEMDEQYIMSRPQPPQAFERYIRAKMEFENVLLANENVRKVMEKVDENERDAKKSDPNYKNIMRKKRIEQKKIEGLMSERNYQPYNEPAYRDRSRTRDNGQFKKQKYQYKDFHPYGYNNQYEARPNFKQNDNLAYKGNPQKFPQRYNLHKIHNPNPRPRPPYATPEKINEIRQHLNQRPDHNQSLIAHSTNPKPKNRASEYECDLNVSFSSNQIENERNILPQEFKEVRNEPEIQSTVQKSVFVKLERPYPNMESGSQQVGSQCHRIESQFQRFHINSSDYSSIYERSKHQFSQLNFQDSHQASSSHFLNSNFNSNSTQSNLVSNQSNGSDLLFEPELEKEVGIIPHNRKSGFEDEDAQICELFNTSRPSTQERFDSNEVNFQVSKKALSYDETETKEPEPQKEMIEQPLKKKDPKKKAQNKTSSNLLS